MWQLVGVLYVVYGLAFLISPRLRDWNARRTASFHRSLHRRARWLYWGRRDPGMAGDEDMWRGFGFIFGVFFIGLGLLLALGVGY